MKIRKGFVSNSSSSCFLVNVPLNFEVDQIVIDRIRSSAYESWSPEDFKKRDSQLDTEIKQIFKDLSIGNNVSYEPGMGWLAGSVMDFLKKTGRLLEEIDCDARWSTIINLPAKNYLDRIE